MTKLDVITQTTLLTSRFSRQFFSQRAMVLLGISILTCTFVTACLGFFSQSVQQALNNDIATYLGAPLVARSHQPLDGLIANIDGLQDPVITQTLTSNASTPDAFQVISLKGISAAYPLQGELIIRTENGEIEAQGDNLNPNTAWLDQRAMDELNLSIGDRVQIGKTGYSVSGEIVFEPDRLTQLQHVLPRVMVSLAGLQRSGITKGNDRSEHRVLLSGSPEQLNSWEARLKSVIDHDFEILKPDAGQHPFSRISLRAKRLSSIVLAFILLLCGGAAAMLTDYAVHRYAAPVAVLRCMGVNRLAANWALCLQLLILAALMSVIGCVIAWLIQPTLFDIVEPHMTLQRVPVSGTDFLAPLSIGLVTVIAFALPKLLQLSSISVMSILRGDSDDKAYFDWTTPLAAAVVCGILWLSSDNLRLTLMLVGTVFLLLVLSVGFGWGLSQLGAQLHRVSRGTLKVAIRSIGRSMRRHLVPLTSVSIAVLAILMTVTLRGSFLNTLQSQMLEVDGNYIYSGLPQENADQFSTLLQQHQVEIKGMYPTVSAKLVAINGIPVNQALNRESESREELRSRVRLSSATVPPSNNQIIEGHWPVIGSNQVSVDDEMMADLDLVLGDKLSFNINGTVLTSEISSRRKYVGGNSRMMFWFMFAPDALQDFRQNRMGGFLLKGDNTRWMLAEINRLFPQIRVIDIERQIEGIRSMMIMLTRLMNTALLLLLGGALMVIIAAAFVGSGTYSVQFALLRTFGLRGSQCYLMSISEQLVIALIASAVGVIGTQLVGGALFDSLFALDYQLNWLHIFYLAGTICAAFAALGWFMAFQNLRSPVRVVLES